LQGERPHRPADGTVSDGPGVERQILRALATVGSATLLSRILGFVRDMVVALAFGAGVTTDAFFVAYRIPNMLRRLLGEGALSAAMVPVVTEYASRGAPAEAARMVRAVLGATVGILSVATVLGVAFAPWIVQAMAPGFARDPGQDALASLLTRVMFPYLALVGLGARTEVRSVRQAHLDVSIGIARLQGEEGRGDARAGILGRCASSVAMRALIRDSVAREVVAQRELAERQSDRCVVLHEERLENFRRLRRKGIRSVVARE
jgi:MFS family permease